MMRVCICVLCPASSLDRIWKTCAVTQVPAELGFASNFLDPEANFDTGFWPPR